MIKFASPKLIKDRMKNYFATLLIFIFSCVLNAQNFNYRLIDKIKTSPSDELRCIYFDNSGLMWIGTSSGLKSYDGYNIRTYRSDAITPGIFPNNSIMSITEDFENNLWIGTRNGLVKMSLITGKCKAYQLKKAEQHIIYTLYTSKNGTIWIGSDGGLSYYDKKKDSFLTYDKSNTFVHEIDGTKKSIHHYYSVKSIIEDNNGNMYVGTWNYGLLRFHKKSNTFYRCPNINGDCKAYSLYLDKKQQLWIGTWGHGIAMMTNPQDFNHTKIRSFNNGTDKFNTYYKILEDPITNTIWACSREGISILNINNPNSGFTNYTNTGGDAPQQLGFNTDMITDKAGNFWLETAYDGITHIDTNPSMFSIWKINNVNINSVCSIFTEDGNMFWLEFKPFGLALYNRATGSISIGHDIAGLANVNDKIIGATFSSIVKRFNGEIWFANNSYGIMIVKDGEPTRIIDRSCADYIQEDYVNTLYQDNNNIMWIGQRVGLSIVYPDNTGVKLKMTENGKDFSKCEIRGISSDCNGNIWVATEDQGIIRISGNIHDPKSLKYHQYNPDNNNYIVDDATICHEDSHNRLWAISRNGGLFIYNKVKDVFESVNKTYHIDNDRVLSINEDYFGNLWITTDKSLVRISIKDKDTYNVTSFANEDGFGDILFQPNATFRYGKELFFGNRKSFFSFIPKKNYNKNYHKVSNLIVTNLFINDKQYSTLDSTLMEKVSEEMPTFTHNITIPDSIEKFSVEFALLSYSHPEQNKYAYKLEGYDNDWRYRDAVLHRATFENLPSGTYKLHIKAADSYGTWHELPYTIKVHVLPPFYATWWAIIIYFFIINAIAFASIKWYKNHLKTKNKLQMAVIFTNITHELLTPLTVISAAIDDLRSQAPLYTSNYNMIQGNITRLTKLLRQILEVRKSQAGQLKLLVSHGDIAEFVKSECNNIMPLINKKDISLTVNCNNDHIDAWFDSDKLDKIIYNLLSNAVKYTRDKGNITVSLISDGNKAILTISDNGIGMSKEKMKGLYHRFLDGDYRRMNTFGTGIGLALTHDLVILHHGKIDCKSEENKGTVFTVDLPITRNSYNDTEIDKTGKAKISAIEEQTVSDIGTNIVTSLSEDTDDNKEYKILIVEDNEELLDIMQKLLSRKYNVSIAKNGQQALNIIAREELDIVISDVMMPVMDGIELTSKIKKNSDLAQLPVILLTAKTQDEDRNKAYETGADEYITKPFKFEDLQLRIDNILINRERIRNKFNRMTTFDVKEQHYSSPDETFIQKAIDCVKNNIEDSEYNRDALASDMCVSSSTLYNKLRALTGQNVTGFINSIRLKEACRIVRQNPYIQVNELSMQVGFNTPKYFTKCFKAEFGMLLKEYIEKEVKSN